MGTDFEIVHTEGKQTDGLVFLDPKGGVWLTFLRPWWDLASWLWWVLSPGPKRWLVVTHDKKKVRVRAVQVAPSHIRMGALKSS
jgi:hypothetical protein